MPGTLGRALQAFYLEMEEEEDVMGRRKLQATPYPGTPLSVFLYWHIVLSLGPS